MVTSVTGHWSFVLGHWGIWARIGATGRLRLQSAIMRVSFVIPALNEAESIARAVDSAWRAGAWETIVADGGSTDDTVTLAKAAGARVVTGARGRAHQQNIGTRAARGDVLLFQHADNWLAPGAVEQIRAALANRRIGGGAFRQRIEAEGSLYRLLERGNAARAARLKLPYGDQGIFVRREVFWAVGGFPDVPIMEDLLLMRKLRRRVGLALLPGPIHVSARRWKRYGVVRQTLRNWALLAAYALGISPEQLARFYARHQ